MKLILTHRVYTHDDGTITDRYDAVGDSKDAELVIHGFKIDYDVWRPLDSELEFFVRQIVTDPERPNRTIVDETGKCATVNVHKKVKSVTIEWE